MMDNLFDDETFSLTFPLWFPIHPDAIGAGVMRTKLENGNIGTPLFTDKDLAERFIASIPGMQIPYILGMAGEPKEILPILNFCAKKGITHVAFDQGLRTARFHLIDDLREKMLSSWQESV